MIILTGASGGIGQDLIKYLSEIDDVVGVYNNTEPKDLLNEKISYEKVNIEDSKAIEEFANIV